MFSGSNTAQAAATTPTPPQSSWTQQGPIVNTNFGATTTATLNLGTMDETERGEYLGNQNDLQTLGMGLNAGGAVLNTITAITGMVMNQEVIGSYYDYMNKVADNSWLVAKKQLEVQEYAIDKASEMQESEQSFQVKLAKIEQAKEIQLARVAERGRTDRTAMYMANNEFKLRESYPGGSPVFSIS